MGVKCRANELKNGPFGLQLKSTPTLEFDRKETVHFREKFFRIKEVLARGLFWPKARVIPCQAIPPIF